MALTWGYPTDAGKREQNKAATRERIADAAATLFAARGYDAVLVLDVARAAEVSEQTVYNYFPAKQDLVLDRAEEIRGRYGAVVRDRAPGTSPADAIRPLLLDDIDRVQDGDIETARGQFAAQCVISPVLRRFGLEFREQQAETIAEAIRSTDPAVPAIVAHAHAAALVAVVQTITDRIGAHVVAPSDSGAATAAAVMRRDAADALDSLDRAFRAVVTTTPTGTPS